MLIAYVDDSEEDCAQSLPVFVEGFQMYNLDVRKIDVFRSSSEFFFQWQPQKYDLIILDILMGEMSGISIAEEVRKKDPDVCIVFCSSSNDYANESYRVDACYYLQKPLSPERVRPMFERIKKKHVEQARFVSLPDGRKVVLRKILYATYFNHQIDIHLASGASLKIRMSFTAFLELLTDQSYFCVTNSGSVVNLYQVKHQGKDFFEMMDGSHISISRRRRGEVQTQYQDFLFQLMREGM